MNPQKCILCENSAQTTLNVFDRLISDEILLDPKVIGIWNLPSKWVIEAEIPNLFRKHLDMPKKHVNSTDQDLRCVNSLWTLPLHGSYETNDLFCEIAIYSMHSSAKLVEKCRFISDGFSLVESEQSTKRKVSLANIFVVHHNFTWQGHDLLSPIPSHVLYPVTTESS